MDNTIFKYLKKDHEDLYNLIEEMTNAVYTDPHSAIVKGRKFGELLARKILKIEDIELDNFANQIDRINTLRNNGLIECEIVDSLHHIRMIGNKAIHDTVDTERLEALKIHKDIYDITYWFLETYTMSDLTGVSYKEPKPVAQISDDELREKVKKLIDAEKAVKDEVVVTVEPPKEKDKKCLIQELSRLKESSKEAVESLNTFSPFKDYMHIKRDAQGELEDIINESYKKEGAQLVLVCGSVGDGKSHIISYFKHKSPDIIAKFDLHNDATESLEPDKTSMDTLNDVLDNFSDEKIESSNQKFILAINLGTLNNFIDSEYGHRFTKLKQFVIDKKILEPGIEDNEFDENSSFQFIDFSDYHLFTLKDGKVKSDYVKSLFKKITEESDINIFYKSYKNNCSSCAQCGVCPIKANYELLKKEEVQDGIVNLLVQSIIKNKIIISTRALLNFIYEILVARSYIDVNSPIFKEKIGKLNNQEYIKSLTPNILFSHKELSFIFESLASLDPLNIRNEKVDDFIIKFNNSNEVMGFFKNHVDLPKNYLGKIGEVNFEETKDTKLRYELLKLFIRGYSLCGVGNLFDLDDKVYENFMTYVYQWNRGEKGLRKTLYSEVKDGILKWNGEADKNHINIFIGKNQLKYKTSEELDIKMDIANLPSTEEVDLKKFLTTLELRFKNEKTNNSYGIEVDFTLYELLIKVTNGYRPNKNDKNHFIKFIEFINKIESEGSQKESLVFTQKNKQDNKKYKLEYNEEYEEYRFVEM